MATTTGRSKRPTICSRSISSARSRCWRRPKRSARQAAKRVIREDRGARRRQRRCRCSKAGTARTSPTGRRTRRSRRAPTRRRSRSEDCAGAASKRAPQRHLARDRRRGAKRRARDDARGTRARRLSQASRETKRAPAAAKREGARASRSAAGTSVRASAHTDPRSSAAVWPDRRQRGRPRRSGVPVTLHEMRPVRPTAVHKTDRLAELVCSNSFRGDKLDNAVGLLEGRDAAARLARDARRPKRAACRPARRWPSIASGSPSRSPSAIAEHPLITDRPRRSHADSRSTERTPVIVAHRSADVRRARPPTSRASSAASTCISTTPSARSCSPRHIDRAQGVPRSRDGIAVCGRPRVGGTPRLAVTRAQPDVTAGVRRRRRPRRLPELPADARRIRAVLRRARARGVGDRSRFRQGEILRGLPADRGDGAPRSSTRCASGR